MTAITKASANSITVLIPISASSIIADTASNYNIVFEVTANSYHGSKTLGSHLFYLTVV
jgi:hypothetical protein